MGPITGLQCSTVRLSASPSSSAASRLRRPVVVAQIARTSLTHAQHERELRRLRLSESSAAVPDETMRPKKGVARARVCLDDVNIDVWFSFSKVFHQLHSAFVPLPICAFSMTGVKLPPCRSNCWNISAQLSRARLSQISNQIVFTVHMYMYYTLQRLREPRAGGWRELICGSRATFKSFASGYNCGSGISAEGEGEGMGGSYRAGVMRPSTGLSFKSRHSRCSL